MMANFHSDNEGVFHFGFDREELHRMFIGAGFRDVRHRATAQVEKAGWLWAYPFVYIVSDNWP